MCQAKTYMELNLLMRRGLIGSAQMQQFSRPPCWGTSAAYSMKMSHRARSRELSAKVSSLAWLRVPSTVDLQSEQTRLRAAHRGEICVGHEAPRSHRG